MHKALFFDRDDTLLRDTSDYCVNSIEKIQLFPDTIEALKLVARTDYLVVIITNQEVISTGRLSETDFWNIHGAFVNQLEPSGIHIDKTMMCPHQALDNCDCRKPKPTMIQRAAQELDIDLSESWMIGDRQTDVQAGNAAGTKTILVKTAQKARQAPEATYVAQTLLEAITYITR